MEEVVAYCRLSDKDSSTNSIANQERKIEEYCNFYNLKLVKTFTDNGKSGWTFDRPAFKELEFYCKLNKSVKYLVVSHFDRFSRTDPIDAMAKERYLRDKLQLKVLQVSEPPNIDTSNQSYLIIRFMTAFASNEERNRIVDRVKSGMVYSLSQGRYCSMAPYGYKNSRDVNNKPLLIIDEPKAEIVKSIFEHFINGLSQEEIRQKIKMKGFDHRSSSAITRILVNPVYAGLVNVPAYKEYKQRTIQGIHQRIISEEIYWRVQNKLNTNYSRVIKRDEVPLRGIVCCYDCGKPLTAAASKGKYNHFWYYFCLTHRKNNYSANTLHKQFYSILEQLSINKSDVAIITEAVTLKLNEAISNKSRDLMRLNLAISKTKDSIASLEEKYLTGPVSVESYTRLLAEKRTHLEQLELEKNELSFIGNDYFDKLNKVLTKMQDIKSQWDIWDIDTKHNFCKMVFELKLYYSEGSYRTPFIHPMFSPKSNEIQHLIIDKKERRLLKNSLQKEVWTTWELNRTLEMLEMFFVA